MRTLSILALAVAMLAMSAELATAQTTDRSTVSGTASRGKPTKEQLTGKVTAVDNQARTFTVLSKGKAVVFSGAEMPTLPKVGQVVDVTYTRVTGGGHPISKTFNESRSNAL
jgi:hypothetical protein